MIKKSENLTVKYRFKKGKSNRTTSNLLLKALQCGDQDQAFSNNK